MQPTHTIDVSGELAAPAAAVWDRISNHGETHTWVLPARVRILEPGQPAPNGKGALREVAFPAKRMWPAIQERVTAFEPPRTFSYAIVKMAGVREHLGTLTVEPLGDRRCRLIWHVDFVFSRWHPMGWMAGPFTRNFATILQEAIDELGRQIEAQNAA